MTSNTGSNVDAVRDLAEAESRRLSRDRWIGWWSGVPLVLGGTSLSIVMIIGFIDRFNYGAAQVLQKDGVTHEVAQIREYVGRERNSSSSTSISKVEATYLDEAGQQRTVNLRSPRPGTRALLFTKVTGALLASLALMSGAAYLLLQSSL